MFIFIGKHIRDIRESDLRCVRKCEVASALGFGVRLQGTSRVE